MNDNLQQRIANTVPDGTLAISPAEEYAEFQGPLVIDHPLAFDGRGCTIWAAKGPVLRIKTDGTVILRNLNIEATGDPDHECALLVERCDSLQMERVRVVGRTQGAGSDSAWRYPHQFMLKAAPGRETTPLALHVPQSCTLRWEIAGIGKDEESHPAGPLAKTFQIPSKASPGDSLQGVIHLVDSAGQVVAGIDVAGWVTTPPTETPPPASPSLRPASGHPRRLAGIAAGMVAVALVLIGATTAWLRTPRIAISPGLVDFGTLFYSPDDSIVNTTFLARIRANLQAVTNPTIMLTTVCVINDTLTTTPDVVVYPLATGSTNIPLSFSLTHLEGCTRSFSMTGLVTVTASPASIALTPRHIAISGNVKPRQPR